ncbi:response regulator [Noviherbaspirillum pedocola]|uniref:Response regulator transcription factor n=1 Tax=Noviherbaspirillum pedocola TaxID=2801341 RepID=A0A934SSK7_9BURK|nr:response regulator transcription factor [Noviherbaspirillum pedocola]MBK4735825.1 response regulator transcription factor [Noviherbaspirillum pedocola]
MTCRVLVVDDHHLLRFALRTLVGGMPGYEAVGEACEGKEAVHAACALKPDLILMDIGMPGMNGTEATVQIRQRLRQVRILMLANAHSETQVREALVAGADGYILKSTTNEEMRVAIHALASGRRYLPPEISMQMIDSYIGFSRMPAQAPGSAALTSRERSILKLVAEGRTNRMAGEFLSISAKTVEKHRASLMRKLGLSNAAELVLAALDLGLIEKEVTPAYRGDARRVG